MLSASQVIPQFYGNRRFITTLSSAIEGKQGNAYKLSILRNKNLIFYVRNIKFNNEYALPK